MPDVQWIKITIDMFDDEKIKLIENMSDADTILIIWIKLLMLASRIKDNGNISLTENTPYTEEELSTILNVSTTILKTVLDVFQKFGMVTIYDQCISINNFDEWVKIDGSCCVARSHWGNMRHFILERDNYTCAYCRDKMGPFHVDHIYPHSRGGSDDEDNLTCACRACNLSKHNKTPEEWEVSKNGTFTEY